MDYMRRNGSALSTIGHGSDSMAVLFRNYTTNNLNSGQVDFLAQCFVGNSSYTTVIIHR